MEFNNMMQGKSYVRPVSRNDQRNGPIRIYRPHKTIKDRLVFVEEKQIETGYHFDKDGNRVYSVDKVKPRKHGLNQKLRTYNCVDCKKSAQGISYRMVRCRPCQDVYSRELKKVWNRFNRKAPLKGPKSHRGL